MKYKHIFWGIILISIGLMFLLANLGVLHFSWLSFWRLWPVILILWGISVLPLKDLYRFILLIGVVVATFIIVNRMPESTPWYWSWHKDGGGVHIDWDEDDTAYSNYQDQRLSVPFDSLATRGILRLEAAAGNFHVDSSTTEFLSFSKTGDIGNYELTTENDSSIKEISLSLQEDRGRHKMRKNNVIIRLNEKVAWDLDLDIGAAAVDMDLSKYRIGKADIEAGAASVEIKLGDLSPSTSLNIDGGVSSFTLRIPKSAGCQVKSESFLVSKEFEGFVKKGDRTHQTENWNSSKSKIYIDLSTAISNIRIERY